MRISLCGAAGEVTGSGYLIETGKTRVLVDFGLFQGSDSNDQKNHSLGHVDPKHLDAVVLTHAHLDHCGRLPMLVKGGFRGPIHATPATIDVAGLILADSAFLQVADLKRKNQRLQRAGKPLEEPLYLPEDAEATLRLFRPLPYEQTAEIVPGISIRFVDAGHILGSASIEMTVRSQDKEQVIGFSGDVGRPGVPLLRDPTPLQRADLLFLESTYGDRDHRSLEDTVNEFHGLIKEAVLAGSKVLIPAFAVGRSQQILYYLAELFRKGNLPHVPVYLDSPMAIKASAFYAKHHQLLDVEATAISRREGLKNLLGQVKPLLTGEESRTLNDSWDPAIIIAGSGMCDGGRILHHLKHNLWRKGVVVVMVGFMGEGTLGRRLIDGAKEVRIYGDTIAVRAKIATLGGFSGHAGQSELLSWLQPLVSSAPRVILTHGENKPRNALRDVIQTRYGLTPECPGPGAVLTFESH